jgi:hypothetical protein
MSLLRCSKFYSSWGGALMKAHIVSLRFVQVNRNYVLTPKTPDQPWVSMSANRIRNSMLSDDVEKLPLKHILKGNIFYL